MTWAPPSPFFWRRRQRPATGDDADGSRPEAQPSLRPHALLAAVFGPTMGREVAALASDSGCTDDEAVDRVAEVVDRLVVLRNAWVVDGPAGRDASADSDRARTMAVAVSDLARRVGVVPRRSWLSRRWRRASSDWDGAAQAADRLRLLQVGMVAAGVYGVSTFTEAHLVTVLRATDVASEGDVAEGLGGWMGLDRLVDQVQGGADPVPGSVADNVAVLLELVAETRARLITRQELAQAWTRRPGRTPGTTPAGTPTAGNMAPVITAGAAGSSVPPRAPVATASLGLVEPVPGMQEGRSVPGDPPPEMVSGRYLGVSRSDQGAHPSGRVTTLLGRRRWPHPAPHRGPPRNPRRNPRRPRSCRRAVHRSRRRTCRSPMQPAARRLLR